jgi:hypothetical protein
MSDAFFRPTAMFRGRLRGPGVRGTVCLDAVSRIDSSGVGVAQSMLWDERGRIGRANQSILVGTVREISGKWATAKLDWPVEVEAQSICLSQFQRF